MAQTLRGAISVSVLLLLAIFQGQSSALTRWSALHFIPDADLLEGGGAVIDCQAYYFGDTNGTPVFNPAALATIGITEWVNISGGYAGGATFGLKARILGETNPFLPSLAIGVQNAFTNRESYFNRIKDDKSINELYLALSKSVDPIKLRFHVGVESVPTVESERINPYFGIEKYFGGGVYVSVEAEKRYGEFHPSLFATWRFWNKMVEISAGAVDLTKMFVDQNGNFRFSIVSDAPNGKSKPGIWAGLRFHTNIGIGTNDGFQGLETRIAQQREDITALKEEIDTLKMVMQNNASSLIKMKKSISSIADSGLDDNARLKAVVLEKLIELKTLYSQEPYEPEQVSAIEKQLTSYRDRIIPVLEEVINDKTQNDKVRLLAVSIVGEIGLSRGSDILLAVLSHNDDPDMKIEALIALGKLKETRAGYLILQLTNDPNDAISFTAGEVLHKLEKETGIDFSVKGSGKDATGAYIDEKKIGAPGVSPLRKNEKKPEVEKTIAATQPADTNKDSSSSFTETTVTEKPQKSDSLTAPSSKIVQPSSTPADSTAVKEKTAEQTPKKNDKKSASSKPATKEKKAAPAQDEKNW